MRNALTILLLLLLLRETLASTREREILAMMVHAFAQREKLYERVINSAIGERERRGFFRPARASCCVVRAEREIASKDVSGAEQSGREREERGICILTDTGARCCRLDLESFQGACLLGLQVNWCGNSTKVFAPFLIPLLLTVELKSFNKVLYSIPYSS